jgi:hypothetical protein
MVCGEKGCPRERNLRAIYTENSVGILETHCNVLSFVFCLHVTEYKEMGGAKFSWAQERKIPTYGPDYTHSSNARYEH